jgi:hypothetical protein
MTASIALVEGGLASFGNMMRSIVDITLDASYPSAGYPIYPRDVGLSGIYGGHVIGSNLPSAGLWAAVHSPSVLGVNYLLVTGGQAGIRECVYSNVRGAPVELAAAENADAAFTSGEVNYAYIGASETFTTMAGHSLAKSHTISVQPDVSRNVVITIINDSGGDLNLYEGITTFTVTGKFRGGTQTELITFTSTSGNKKIASASNHCRYKAGVKPFDSITSIVYDNGAAATLKCAIGLGLRFGIPVALLTPDYTDVLKIWFGAPSTTAAADVAVATGRVVSTVGAQTFNIGDPTSVAAAEYATVGAIFNGLTGVVTGANLAAYTVRVMFIGI